jgi:hypothetical protein
MLKRAAMLRMQHWLFLIAPVALVACDRAEEQPLVQDEREDRAAVPPDVPPNVPPKTLPTTPATPPAPSKDAPLSPKHKPVVMDLGGAQAAQAVGCALTVRFGSIGTGTDTVAGAQIRRLIEEDPGVAQIERFIVGREGETVTCIRLKVEGEADRLFDKLRQAAADAYLVTIWSKTGREFHSPRKRL